VFIPVANRWACLERVYPRDTTDTASEDPNQNHNSIRRSLR
jgi:hypothetical protein